MHRAVETRLSRLYKGGRVGLSILLSSLPSFVSLQFPFFLQLCLFFSSPLRLSSARKCNKIEDGLQTNFPGSFGAWFFHCSMILHLHGLICSFLSSRFVLSFLCFHSLSSLSLSLSLRACLFVQCFCDLSSVRSYSS